MTSAIDTESSARPAPFLCVFLHFPLLLDTLPCRRTLLETGLSVVSDYGPYNRGDPFSRSPFYSFREFCRRAPSGRGRPSVRSSIHEVVHRTFCLQRAWKNAYSLAPWRSEARQGERIKSRGAVSRDQKEYTSVERVVPLFLLRDDCRMNFWTETSRGEARRREGKREGR